MRKTGPVGIQEIADPSEIPKESFYNYFPSKDHFLLEVLEEGGLPSLRFLYEKK
ncbi:TetR/AcrR family transcriptional regulator [Leptospira borgpetersenii]|uniref:TetR/AcrR family transcriptional regulator n=1 Tax=Leptospira borgpetersenii TaxID=174 RepID=UPI001D148D88|nr:TetR/AcrR family transcriptional regulator [Leptospira borgpetersenii]